MSDNLTAIFSKEIEKLNNSVDEIKEEINVMSHKLLSLVDKLENSVQQYGLVYHESENCSNNLSSIITIITDKVLLEILKIKNPNETFYELMKMFYKIIIENKPNQINSNNITWQYLQANFKTLNIQNELKGLLSKDQSKDLIDQCMPFNIQYSELKTSLSKINKNLIFILDLIKCVVDFNIKKSIVKSLYHSNVSKREKMNNLKEQILSNKQLVKDASDYVPIMQSELTELLNRRNSTSLIRNIIIKYNFIHKYKILYSNDDHLSNMNISNNDFQFQLYNTNLNVIIKIKSKYKFKEEFVKSILLSRDKNINVYSNTVVNENSNSGISNVSVPKLKIPKITQSALENTSTRSRNIQNNIYMPNMNTHYNNSYNQLSNFPSKIYYTTEREKYKDNLSISHKHKSIGSTIYRDIETLENIIKEDRNCDVVPIDFAVKPGPKKVVLVDQFDHKNKSSSFIIDTDEIRKSPIREREEPFNNSSNEYAKNIFSSNSNFQLEDHLSVEKIKENNLNSKKDEISNSKPNYTRKKNLETIEGSNSNRQHNKRISSIFEEIKKDNEQLQNGNIFKY